MEILFEDSHIIAVNKPAGIPSNRLDQSSISQPSCEERIAEHYSQLCAQPPILLHRLDVGTSGVLLFARDLETYERMRRLFKERKIEKHYWAWSHNHVELPLPFEIQNELAHHAKSKKRMIVVDREKMAKRPQTFYRGEPLPAVSRIHQVRRDGDLYRYDVEIETGVMHQIRVHMKSIGAPLVGDPIYGDEANMQRLGLHAHSVRFQLGNFQYEISGEARSPFV